MKKLLFLVTFFIFVVTPIFAKAATFFFDPIKTDTREGSDFTVKVMLDPTGQFINAIEGRLIFPSGMVKIKKIEVENSIVSFWIKKPDIKRSGVEFSGIIPGGFDGTRNLSKPEKFYPGEIFSITFNAKKSGTGEISLKDIMALLNDGLGGQVEISVVPFIFESYKSEDIPRFHLNNVLALVIILLIIIGVFISKRRNK